MKYLLATTLLLTLWNLYNHAVDDKLIRHRVSCLEMNFVWTGERCIDLSPTPYGNE